jgi:DNA replication protein DnaC
MKSPEKILNEARLISEEQANNDFSSRRKRRRQVDIEQVIKRAGIPKRFESRSFDDYRPLSVGCQRALDDCRAYAGAFESIMLPRGACLILTGNPGTGKTHLACAVLSHVMRNGYSGLFITVSDMLRTIRSTYNPSSQMTEQEVYDRYISADLLVLDEVGLSIGKDSVREVLIFDVLNGRYSAVKPTIILGNLMPDKMRDYLGFRVWDRLQENNAPLVVFDWESYRSNG